MNTSSNIHTEEVVHTLLLNPYALELKADEQLAKTKQLFPISQVLILVYASIGNGTENYLRHAPPLKGLNITE